MRQRELDPDSHRYPIRAALTLVLFLALGALHLLGLSGLYAIPVTALMLAFLLVVVFQGSVIWELNGGRAVPRIWLPSFGLQWRLVEEGLRVIPSAWRWIGLLLWFVYVPAMFVGYVFASGGRLGGPHGAALFALILAVFSYLHFLAFRFVLPHREEILLSASD